MNGKMASSSIKITNNEGSDPTATIELEQLILVSAWIRYPFAVVRVVQILLSRSENDVFEHFITSSCIIDSQQIVHT